MRKRSNYERANSGEQVTWGDVVRENTSWSLVELKRVSAILTASLAATLASPFVFAGSLLQEI